MQALVEDIVSRFGGPERLAKALELGTSKAVEQWIRRGTVPGKWHLSLLSMAAERGIKLSPDELLNTTKRNRALH